MKNLLTLCLLPLFSDAQNCEPPVCATTVAVNLSLTNKAYSSSVCFEGAGTVTNSVNWNNWHYLSFKHQLYVEQTINMAGRVGKAYSSGTNRFKHLTMDGFDTVWQLNGSLIIDRLETNNSNTNVIMTPGQAVGVIIEGKTYYPGEYFQQQGNPTNRVYIGGCNNTILSLHEREATRPQIKPEIYFDGAYLHAGREWVSVEFLDASGRLLAKSPVNGKYLLGRWPSGVYFSKVYRKTGNPRILKIIL